MFEDVSFHQRPYDPWSAYGQSKTANILFAVALDARGRDQGIRAFSLHPGGIITNLAKHMTVEALQRAGNLDAHGEPVIDPSRDMKSIPQGAATQVWCAVTPLLSNQGGMFCADSDVAPVIAEASALSLDQTAKRAIGVEAYAIDPGEAERLWTRSEQLAQA